MGGGYMTWTYSGDPGASDKDLVRFMIGDTAELQPELSDEEILYLLAQHGRPIAAAAEACQALFARYIKQVDYTIGPESVKASDRAKAYAALKKNLEDQMSSTGKTPSADISGRPIFDIGMHDNRYGRGGLRG